MNEFEMIREYFLPLTLGRAEAADLEDDAAVLNVPDGFDLVISSDTLNAGVHFLKTEAPENVAHKALRVNLSDIAAMGAKPYSYQMNVAFQNAPDIEWVKRFSGALLEDSKEFDVFCSGGDTTVTEGPMLISITITGLVPKGGAVHRTGARTGDLAVVTGNIGDAAIGVKVLLDALHIDNAQSFLDAAHRPVPRVAISDEIREYAQAAIDISDGLIADFCHICGASELGLRLNLADVPLSAGARALIENGTVDYEQLVTGGEDYEIAMAVAPEDFEAFQAKASAKGIELSVVGVFEEGNDLLVFDADGKEVHFKRPGWTHF